MITFDSPASSTKPYRLTQSVRFGNQTPPESEPLTPAPMTEPADLFRQALKQAESMPGSDQAGLSPFQQIVAQLLNGDAAFGRKLAESIHHVITGTAETRNCIPETYMIGSNPRQGYRVKSGTLDKLFQKRNLTGGDSMAFEDFLEKKWGKTPRVIISMTGWTKPPVDSFLENEFYARQMKKLPKEQWPKFVETVYVNIIKQFLDDVVQNLTTELPEFNPVTDLGIIYGVTPQGVDKGVQDYCLQKSIPIVGLTCYDWAEYVPDEAGLPDVYITKDPASFGRLIADSSNKIVVTGGRSFAASVKLDGKQAKGADRRIAADLLKSYAGVIIPPVVPGEDEMSALVTNAAALTKIMGGDPWNFEVVQRAINGRHTDNPDVFATTHILKKELEKLYQIRKMIPDFTQPTETQA
jgi:hypothetical protein